MLNQWYKGQMGLWVLAMGCELCGKAFVDVAVWAWQLEGEEGFQSFV